MEAVGIGASVAALIVLGLKSAKIIHETLSTVEDGPRTVPKAADDVLQLYWILERLQSCRAGAEDSSLRGHAKNCADDLSAVANAIQKLQPRLGERGTTTLWKRLNVFLSEKELVRMSSTIQNHISVLSLRLSILQSDAVFGTRDMLQQCSKSTVTINQSMHQSLRVQDASFSILQEQSHKLTEMNDGMNSLRSDVGSIRDAVSAVPSVSSTQADTMLRMLRELQGQVSALSLQHETPTASEVPINSRSKISVTANEPKGHDRDEDADMVEGIERLCELVNHKEHTLDIYDDESTGSNRAESIIEALQAILESAKNQGSSEHRLDNDLFTSIPQSTNHDPTLSTDLKRLSRVFSAATKISINRQGRTRPIPVGTSVRQKRKSHQLSSNIGTISVIVVKRRKSYRDGTNGAGDEEDEFLATVTFKPYQPRRFHMLAFHVDQGQILGETRVQIPRLEVNRVLPWDSLIFKLVKDGRVEDVQALIRAGKASLRDHDEDGAPLIFFATKQPEMCRFLTENGADLDEVGVFFHFFGSMPDSKILGSVLHVEDCDYYDSYPNFDAINQCRRILLDKGADPAIDLGEGTPIQRLARCGTKDTIQAFWASANVLADCEINTPDSDGRTVLLELATRNNVIFRETFSLLLDRGADIRAYDNAGRTCLHLYLRNMFGSFRKILLENMIKQQQTLVFLVQRGANIHAKDIYGSSVSDTAYRLDAVDTYAGDVWDSVLAACGHDVASFAARRRRSLYTMMYTREDFERIWKGQEHLCPYWNEPLHDSEPDV